MGCYSRQVKKKNSFPDDDASDTGFSTCEEAHHSLKEILNKLEINYHFSHFQVLEGHFGFPCSVESLILMPKIINSLLSSSKCTGLAQ